MNFDADRLFDALAAIAREESEDIARRAAARQARAARREAKEAAEREAAELAAIREQEARDAELDARAGTGPWCDAMDIHPVSGEVRCILPPGHDDEECEDAYGHRWPHENCECSEQDEGVAR